MEMGIHRVVQGGRPGWRRGGVGRKEGARVADRADREGPRASGGQTREGRAPHFCHPQPPTLPEWVGWAGVSRCASPGREKVPLLLRHDL